MSEAARHVRVVTAQAPGRVSETWRYREASQPEFDPVVFDAAALRERGLITGVADAGRGGTVFFDLDGTALVLREYRRGGLIRHISTRAYVQSGLERSRAMREFSLLLQLEALGLPAPVVFAARRIRNGLLESGELVTHRLNGVSLAERIAGDDCDNGSLEAVGQCIARFHAHGVEHADLNVHNILIDDGPDGVQLLDFDRGRMHVGAAVSDNTPWARNNLSRLARSFERIGAATAATVVQSAWREALASLSPSASR